LDFFTAQHRSLPEEIKNIPRLRKFYESFGGLPDESPSRGGILRGFLRSAAFACSTSLTQVINAHSQLKPKHTTPHFNSQPDGFCGIVSLICA
jgi:hypothetical protein